MNPQTRMRAEKNHQQHAKKQYKTNQNHNSSSEQIERAQRERVAQV